MRLGLEQILLGQIVHPVEIGRDKDIGRRRRLDLLRQGRARRIGGGGFLACFAAVGGVHLVERIFETGRGKNDQLGILRQCRGAPRAPHQNEKD